MCINRWSLANNPNRAKTECSKHKSSISMTDSDALSLCFRSPVRAGPLNSLYTVRPPLHTAQSEIFKGGFLQFTCVKKTQNSQLQSWSKVVGTPLLLCTKKELVRRMRLLFLKDHNTNDFACHPLPHPLPSLKAMLKQTSAFPNVLQDGHQH